MSLYNLNELLPIARKNSYAVVAANPFNFDSAESVIAAAEEKKSPLILQICDQLFKYFNFEYITNPIIELSKKAKVPIAIHLDHGTDFNVIMKAIKAGLTSVMYDGSQLPLNENINNIREIVKIAHTLGVTVEGEVGIVGNTEGGQDGGGTTSADKYTSIEDAVLFVDKTGVDALAIAVGTAHGVYKNDPDLDFERIKDIKEAVTTPLVLHGGSGLPGSDYREAIKNGITKINCYTDLVIEATKKAESIIKSGNGTNYMELNYLSMQSIKEKVMSLMDIFGSSGRA